jgi:hypothetical protein
MTDTALRPHRGQRALAIVSVLAVTAAATWLGTRSRTEISLAAPAASVVPVSHAELTCPAVDAGRRRVIAVAPKASSSGVRIAPTDPNVTPSGSTPQPARVVSFSGSSRRSLDATADGDVAPGVAAISTFVPAKQPGSGVGVCSAPSAQAWFTPLVTTLGSSGALVLANPTSATTVVDLEFLGPHGIIKAVGRRGIAIAAGGTKRINLTSYAPGADELTVGVIATQGLAVAGVQNTVGEGADVVGAEWVNAAQEPGTDVVVDPSPSGRGRRHLVIANTSDSDALVKVQALSPDGAFTPTALPSVQIKPGRTISKDVSKISGKDPTGWRLISNVPVVAGSTTVIGSDYAVATTSAALTEPVVVPALPRASLEVALAAEPRKGGGVTVTAYDAAGRVLGSKRFAVPGGEVRTWRYRAPAREGTRATAAYAVITVEDGAGVHGGAVFTTSAGSAGLPLSSARWNVLRALPAYRSGL